MKVSILDKLEIGAHLDAYHDGKISPNRLVVVIVDDIIPRRELSKKAQNLWRKALKEDFKRVFGGCSFYCGPNGLYDLTTTEQFWDWNCDKFIVGHIVGDKRTEKDPILFAKRPEGFGWYGTNWNFCLDLTGRFRKNALQRWRTCAKERGLRMKWNSKEGRYDYFDLKSGKKVED